jgi:hypothetical protein
MNEGWLGDKHFILFTETESQLASSRYAIGRLLPGFVIVGLRGWDDFLLRDTEGCFFTIPTVPLDRQYLEPTPPPNQSARLEADARFSGKIKWYRQPIVFGGDADSDDNMIWVNHDEHAQLVVWWNELYRDVSAPQKS